MAVRREHTDIQEGAGGALCGRRWQHMDAADTVVTAAAAGGSPSSNTLAALSSSDPSPVL